MTQALPIPVKKGTVSYWPALKENGQSNYGPKFVRKAMPWFEQYWHERHHYPSAADIINRFGCTLAQVESLNRHKFWLSALDRRGIARPGYEMDILSDKQIAAITLLTNFHVVEDVSEKLASIGVSEEVLNGWYANPHFKRALADRADTILDNVSSTATTELARAISRGDFRAIKFYFEITGQAQSPESVNVKRAMQILIEAVQKHVKDEATLTAIGNEVQQMRAIEGL